MQWREHSRGQQYYLVRICSMCHNRRHGAACCDWPSNRSSTFFFFFYFFETAFCKSGKGFTKDKGNTIPFQMNTFSSPRGELRGMVWR